MFKPFSFRGLPLVLSLVVALASWASAKVDVGDRPTIDLRSFDGKPVNNRTLAGRLVILEFWATWCGPCRAQIPHLKQLHADYQDKGVALVSVSTDQSAAVAQKFVRENGMNWVQTHDRALSGRFGVRGIPHAFILSPDGEVLWRGHPARLDGVLDGFLESHPPRVGEGDDGGVPAETVDAALAALDKAREAVQAADYPGVLSALEAIDEAALSDRRVVGQARVLLAHLRKGPEAAAGVEAARAAAPEASAKLDAVLAAVAPRAAAHGRDLLAAGESDRGAQLIERKLAQAEAAHEREAYAEAHRHYTWLVEKAGGSDAGARAAERIAAYEADEEIITAIRAAQAEDAARALLAMAEGYEQAGRDDLARDHYRKIVEQHAGTDAAARAEAKLGD